MSSGGARPGSGRKPRDGEVKAVTVRIRQELYDLLPVRGKELVINSALEMYYANSFNRRVRIVELYITRRYQQDSPPIIIKEIPTDMPRNDIFKWLESKYTLSGADIISISAVLKEPDGTEYESVGDHDWILIGAGIGHNILSYE